MLKLLETEIQAFQQVFIIKIGYGFIEFISHEVAEQVLKLYNGIEIPGTKRTFRLNWGAHSGALKATGNTPIINIPAKTESVSEDFSVESNNKDLCRRT